MISGANRGIGLAIARRLAADGYQLSLGGRDRDAVEAAAATLPTDAVTTGRYDAADRSSPAEWVAATVERFGGVDVVVNNAGMLDRTRVEDLDDAILDELWEVNLKAPLRLVQAALPHLRASGRGRIVNVSSLSGKRVKSPVSPGYAISKFALQGLTHSLRMATWDDGIRVTALCPGFVSTDMTAELGLDVDQMVQVDDLAALVSTVIALPNTASVAELLVACQLEASV